MIFSLDDHFEVGVPASVGLKSIGGIARCLSTEVGGYVDMEKSGCAKGLHCMRREKEWENGY